MSILLNQIKKLPEEPGVYFFIGEAGVILYIGKATSLRDRVASYFRGDLLTARGQLIVDMIPLTKKIEFRKTDSVLEALLLEADLIKKFKPPHNTRDKDDKSYNCVVITDEDFPRVIVMRKKTLDETFPKEDVQYIFGPFPQGSSLRQAMKIIRKIFPFRDSCIPFDHLSEKEKAKAKPCFNAQIGLCPGICMGKVSKKEYQKTIAQLKIFFEGKKAKLIRELETEMKQHAKGQEFEKANEAKRRIFALQHIQDMALIQKDIGPSPIPSIQRIESYDIAHTSGDETVGVMTVLESGSVLKSDYRKFKIISRTSGNDIGALKELLTRRLSHTEWPYPDLMIVDGGVAQKNAFEDIVEHHRLSIPVVSVVKDDKHRPNRILGDFDLVEKLKKEILLANSESHRFAISFHRYRRGKTMRPWIKLSCPTYDVVHPMYDIVSRKLPLVPFFPLVVIV